MLHCYLCNKSWAESAEPLYLMHMARLHSFRIDPQTLTNKMAILMLNRVPAAAVTYDVVLNQLIDYIYQAGLDYTAMTPQEVYNFVAGLLLVYFPNVPCPSRIKNAASPQ